MKRTLLACAVGTMSYVAASNAAVYEVEVLPANELAENTFARTIDNTGLVTVSTQFDFNAPINLSLLNFDNQSFLDLLDDPDAARTGDFTDLDYIRIILTIRETTAQNSPFDQKLAEFRAVQYDGQSTVAVPGFDVATDETNGLTLSNRVLVNDTLNGEVIVGTSQDSFESLNYVNEDGEELTYVINDFRSRGFVHLNGNTTALTAPYSELGGFSEAFAINQNYQVAGSGITEANEAIEQFLEGCADPETRGDVPEEVCLWQLENSLANITGSVLDAVGQIRPIIWTLDTNGQVVSSEIYDLLVAPEPDSIGLFDARALDINDVGIAVGYSDTTSTEAAVFNNGETTRLIDDPEFNNSFAYAINNNNWVAGTVLRGFNSIGRNKLVVTNIDSGEVREVVGFFPSSDTTPRDINNNNIVVGEGEFEQFSSGVRDIHAFMYDIADDTFTDLNDLIACDSPYLLVDATGINDSNEIIVSARVRQASRDPLGNDIVDSEGNPSIADGVVSLKLTPVPNGQIDDCSGIVVDPNTERQGASVTPAWMMLILLGIYWRRKQK